MDIAITRTPPNSSEAEIQRIVEQLRAAGSEGSIEWTAAELIERLSKGIDEALDLIKRIS